MAYTIKIHYQTGDSFHTEERTGCIDYEWKNLKRAQESIERIKNHYEFYKENSNVWEKPKGKLPIGVEWEDKHRFIMLTLMGDDGKPFHYSDFWTGYFERLHLAEIVLVEDTLGQYRP